MRDNPLAVVQRILNSNPLVGGNPILGNEFQPIACLMNQVGPAVQVWETVVRKFIDAVGLLQLNRLEITGDIDENISLLIVDHPQMVLFPILGRKQNVPDMVQGFHSVFKGFKLLQKPNNTSSTVPLSFLFMKVLSFSTFPAPARRQEAVPCNQPQEPEQVSLPG